GDTGCASQCHDHVDIEADQLGGEAREPLELPLRAPDLERQVLAFDVPQFLQPLLEAREDTGEGDVRWGEDADPKDFPWWLRVGSAWRHEDGKGQRRNEPNGREPHGGLLLRHGVLLSAAERWR